MNERLFNGIDIIVVPLVLLFIVLVLIRYRKKQPPQIQKYLLPAFFLRAFGTVALSALVEIYYGVGDTYQYYYNAEFLRGYFFKDPGLWLKVMFQNPGSGAPEVAGFIDHVRESSILASYVFENPVNANVSKIASVFNIFCFNSSIGIALFFGLFSFLGCWYIFKTFTHIYPGYERQLAWFCLFLPSLWFWGSGILKDPICIFGLGLLFYNFFVKRPSVIKRVLLICLGAFLILSIKPYIFYAFCGAAVLGALVTFFGRVNFVVKAGIILAFAGSLVLAYPLLTSLATDSFEEVLKEPKSYINEYNKQTTEDNSDIIPVFDPSPAGFTLLAVRGFFTVYLRPFPWELRKILYIFLIMENLLLYYIIFKRIKAGPLIFKKNYRAVANFSVAFFVLMGIIVGVTAFNFGTIARYRVPALPFLFTGVFIIKLSKRKKKEITGLLNRRPVLSA